VVTRGRKLGEQVRKVVLRQHERGDDLARSDVRALVDAILRLTEDTQREMTRALPPRVLVLRLAIMRGKASPSEIAEVLDMGPASVTRDIHELEEEGQVRIFRNPRDARFFLVVPTETGIEEMRRLDESGEDVMFSVVANWDPDEVRALSASLTRLARDWTRFRNGESSSLDQADPRAAGA
jgi:DNA-binding MarR family transcriptional regulator